MEVIQKGKQKRLDLYRKSLHLSNESKLLDTKCYSSQAMFTQFKNSTNYTSKHRSSMSPNKSNFMLENVSSADVINTDNHPRPPNFFHQAYIAKSAFDAISERGSRLSKSKTIGNLPILDKNTKTKDSRLPNINKRFNENEINHWSTSANKSKKLPLINSTLASQDFKISKNSINKPKGTEMIRYQQNGNKTMDQHIYLIDSVNKLNLDEAMNAKSQHYASKNWEKENKNNDKQTLNDIGEEQEDDEQSNIYDREISQENRDTVNQLHDDKNLNEHKADALYSKQNSLKSIKSTKSSIFIAKLQKQIDDDKKERAKMEREIKEMKK